MTPLWIQTHNFQVSHLFNSLSTVSSDFTADERMEIESIKMYKKDLLDDIQVMCTFQLDSIMGFSYIFFHCDFITIVIVKIMTNLLFVSLCPETKVRDR